jgi:hypothetical protein
VVGKTTVKKTTVKKTATAKKPTRTVKKTTKVGKRTGGRNVAKVTDPKPYSVPVVHRGLKDHQRGLLAERVVPQGGTGGPSGHATDLGEAVTRGLSEHAADVHGRALMSRGPGEDEGGELMGGRLPREGGVASGVDGPAAEPLQAGAGAKRQLQGAQYIYHLRSQNPYTKVYVRHILRF